MNAIPEVVERELTCEELAERYRAMCDDPRFENLQGKIELDTWGRMIMSPASIEFHAQDGLIEQTRFAIDLTGLFGV